MVKLKRLFCTVCAFAVLISATGCGRKADTDEGQMQGGTEDKEYAPEETEYGYYDAIDEFLAMSEECTPWDFESPQIEQRDPSNYPSRFDLRDRGVVTPVKNQTPFGTCWGFSTVAASEISILSELGRTYADTKLDLSEHHLAYFANSYLRDGSSQDGEGIHTMEGYNQMNLGSTNHTATAILSSGIGLNYEQDYPYCGKNRIESEDGPGYSEDDDWSISADEEFVQTFELENSFILPETAVVRNMEFVRYDEQAILAVKDELMKGRGVTVSYNADDEYYNEETFAQYAYVYDLNNHQTCIVGWDDSFPRTAFLDRSSDPDGDGTPQQPPKDGAWIVKNSWGAQTEDFPNDGDYGIINGQGQSTGYFYLSYYDKSIESMESFDYLVENPPSDYYMVDQYDYLVCMFPSIWYSEEYTAMSNVFAAEENELLRCISVETWFPQTEVEWKVVLLGGGYADPSDGETAAEGSEKFEYAGYHRINLDSTIPVEKGQEYAVIFSEKTTLDEQEIYVAGCDFNDNRETAEKRTADGESVDSYAVGIINPGESWLYSAVFDMWFDWADVIGRVKSIESGYDYDNFPIKGYADPAA